MTEENTGPQLPRTWQEDGPDFDAWRLRMSKTDLFGIPSGLPTLDKATRGVNGLVIINGKPGEGKTSLILQIVTHAAQLGIPVLYFLTEMASFLLYARTLARLAKVDFWDVVKQTPEKRAVVQQAEAQVQKFWGNVTIADSRSVPRGRFTLYEIQVWTHSLTQKFGRAPVVVVDHVQNIDSGFPSTNLKDRMDVVASTLASLASRYQTTVLGISEKNRANYETAAMEGSMGSASWEYNADILMSLMAEPRASGIKSQSHGSKKLVKSANAAPVVPDKRALDLVILKQRLMPPTSVPLWFYPEMSLFVPR